MYIYSDQWIKNRCWHYTMYVGAQIEESGQPQHNMFCAQSSHYDYINSTIILLYMWHNYKHMHMSVAISMNTATEYTQEEKKNVHYRYKKTQGEYCMCTCTCTIILNSTSLIKPLPHDRASSNQNLYVYRPYEALLITCTCTHIRTCMYAQV